MENEKEVFATHSEVRAELMKMQKYGGAMINPFALQKVIFMLFSDKERQAPNSLHRARFIATTFCALCNEYWLIYCFDKHAKTEFFVSEERWERYFILPNQRDMAIKFLQEIELIACDTKVILPENKSIQTYRIRLDTLQLFRKAAEEMYDEARAKKNPL